MKTPDVDSFIYFHFIKSVNAKSRLIQLLSLFFCILSFNSDILSQKVTIKDTDDNILMEISDEGNVGSILLLPDNSPLLPRDKLYNLSGDLYWSNIKIGTSKEAAGWKFSGSDLFTIDITTSVGIGTDTPLYPLHIEGSSSNDVSLLLKNRDNTGYARMLFGSNPGTDGSIVFFGPSSPLNANKFRFNNNRVGGLFEWYINGNPKMSLYENGPLLIFGKIKIGDDGSAPSEGVIRYNSGSQKFEGYNGSWYSFDKSYWMENGSHIYYNNGNVGIGTSNPTTKLHILQSSTTDVFRVDDAPMDATPFIIKDDGYVGIGISTPGYPLEVLRTNLTSNINPIASFRSSGDNSAGAVRVEGSNGNYWNFGITQNPDNAFAINYNANISSATDLFRLTPAGFLGIGATTPGARLHVKGDGRIEDTNNPILEYYDGTIYEGFTGFINDEMYISNWLNSNLFLQTQNTPRMTINGIGDVGIGTETPSGKLHIEGNSSTEVAMKINNLDPNGNQQLVFGTNPANDAGIILFNNNTSGSLPGKFRFINNRTSGHYEWITDGQVTMALNNDGRLGVGEDAPAAKTHIAQVDAADALRVDDSTNDLTPLIVKDDGDVGVGIISPTAKMHIVQTVGGEDAFRVDDESSDTSPFVIKSNGAIGQGTMIPQAKMHIIEENINDVFRVDDESGDDSPFIIDEDGNVGIGTDNPSEAFEYVEGDYNILFGEYENAGDWTYYPTLSAYNTANVEAKLAQKTIRSTPGGDELIFYGLRTEATSSGRNYGIHASASGGQYNIAGAFFGEVYVSSDFTLDGNADLNADLDVSGTLSKGSGSFKIDHPLDPENKYLYHSFVESPDMMNVYNGNVTTDSDGYATVEMPTYFEALNKDFRYQLTVIGTFAQAIISEEISNNYFVIRTDQPHVKVSWQITGIRNDAYARKNRIEVEVDKKPEDRGTYLHPEAFGKAITLMEGYEEM